MAPGGLAEVLVFLWEGSVLVGRQGSVWVCSEPGPPVACREQSSLAKPRGSEAPTRFLPQVHVLSYLVNLETSGGFCKVVPRDQVTQGLLLEGV